MEYLAIDNTIGVKCVKNNSIMVQTDKNTYTCISINSSNFRMDRDFITKNITPNFSVEMFYYVLIEFIKYDNYKLIDTDGYYIFRGHYHEPYEQGDIPYSAKVKTPLKGWSSNFGHYGTRVRCQKLAPQRGA